MHIAIIGVGAIGERMIPVFLKHPSTSSMSIYDVDAKSVALIAKKYELNAVSSLAEILENKAIDAVYLAVPPKYHADIALQVLDAKKHLLCEKPLAGTIDEALRMALAGQRAPVVQAMNFPMPYTSAFKALENRILAGDLGDLLSIEVRGVFPDWPRKWQVNPWIDTREEGGFVREVFTHFIQLIIQLYGPIDAIVSSPQYPLDQSRSEVGLVGWGKLKNRVMVSFNGITQVAEPEHLVLKFYGTKGTLEIINWRDLYFTSASHPRALVALEANDASYDLVDAFFGAIKGHQCHLVDFEMGYQTVRVVESLLSMA